MNSKLIMGAAGGLLLGLGGGTGFVVMTKPDAPPPAVHAAADSLAADSLTHTAAADTGTHAPVAHDPADAKGAETQSPAGASATKTVSGAHGDSPAPKPVTPPQVTTAAAQPDSTSLRLGRIFGAMKPEDAAAVLSKLEDGEVKAVLFQLSDRKAAEILARFPGERAANLTKTLLTDARTR